MSTTATTTAATNSPLDSTLPNTVQVVINLHGIMECSLKNSVLLVDHISTARKYGSALSAVETRQLELIEKTISLTNTLLEKIVASL